MEIVKRLQKRFGCRVVNFHRRLVGYPQRVFVCTYIQRLQRGCNRRFKLRRFRVVHADALVAVVGDEQRVAR